ncbi:homoserine dehydrogenase [Roseiarcus fermentans]|uniref:Homoserine dehydrogenase n=1 Tax=Roseiarcus fermentans TaxID=1473586 RepID=A0A366FT51_9HYPH|nr:homoserine dehydrogenase [Roseiarcus fermentans]RBP16915.1 homoserine dehydrogenase [Roseiarcus fermentans]
MTEPLRLGVAGLGNVGTGLARLLLRQGNALSVRAGRGMRLAAYSARKSRDGMAEVAGARFHDDAAALASAGDIDVFVELIGGAGGVAFEAVKAALRRGLPVVTANKAMLAEHGLELAALSEAHDAPLFYEAAVGGGIPVIKTLRESLAGNAIERVSGILNGTCNYILSKMEQERLPFDACLAEAQRRGYAEADPTFDVGGFDTAHKLAILASLAFGSKIDSSAVAVEGIESIAPADIAAADELGFRIKLLGVAERTPHGVEQRVAPTMVEKGAPLAQTMGVLNAVSIVGDAIGELTLVGPGAGGDATASAVAADLVDVARGARLPTFGRPVATLTEADRVPLQRHEGGYYVRLTVVDRPGAMAAIATRFGDRMISLEAIMQKRATREWAEAGVVPVVLMTHGTSESSIRDALARTVEEGVVRERPQVIRIEREAV